ncbi:MAG: polyphosphate kinase 1 [Pseudomonadota bacterium]
MNELEQEPTDTPPGTDKRPETAVKAEAALSEPEHFYNRELGLLKFNWRVLAQAADNKIPLLERLRYLCISCTNLDEFFEIRVAGLKQRQEINASPPGPDKRTAEEVLRAVSDEAHQLVESQYRELNDTLLPALRAAGIRFLRRSTWNDAQRAWLHDYFHKQVVPVLTPLTLDPSRPFPQILNKSLNFIVGLRGRDVYGRRRHRGLVQAPRSLPRLIRLPSEIEGCGDEDYVFLSSVIHKFVEELFPGLNIDGCYQFRVTRNGDLYVDDEEVDDLIRVLEGELAASRYGAAVRLEVDHQCPEELSTFLLDHFELDESDLYRVRGPVNLNRLMMIADTSQRAELKFQPFTPGVPEVLMVAENPFEAIAKKDVLLHHPFQSFAPVIDLLAAAAADPNVLAIKQTLYRTGPQSPVVDHLVAAARAGKEVTVVVELMARFDEAANIELSSRLQEAGAHVIFGVLGYKTHAKMLLIVRREGEALKRYVHLGTGNYHPKTTRLYTDYGLLTAAEDIGQDVHNLFMRLSSLTNVGGNRKLLSSPFELHTQLLKFIRRERRNALAGKPARIVAKINSLIEPRIISALYAASNAGVQIDLIVRGICILRPGVPGLSENIRVRSIIGRFLEHSRVYSFHNNGRQVLLLGSADWMDRNFFRRIETCFPVRRKSHINRINEDLQLYLDDTLGAWDMLPDGRYERLQPGPGRPPLSAQLELLTRYGAQV